MAKDVRKVTGNVISAVEDGFLSWETVAKAALAYMSEDDVADMAQSNDWALFPDEDEKICPECEEELGEDGRCYNPDCDQYDPLSQYFDDEDEYDTLDESQSQEIGNAYRRVSKYYGVDLNELVYGPDGFIATKYPDGFDVSADIIYLEDKWDEFEQWMKEEHGIDFEAIREKNLEETLEEAAGGNALDMTVEDIAEKHGVAVDDIEKQIKIGVEIEQEHTSDEEQAKRIAMDHLVEFPDYYDRLVKMEKEAEAELGTATDESEALEEALNYDKLNFQGLTGDHELEYEDVPVLNQFDEDMEIDYTLDIEISQEMVIDFICEYYVLARDILTMEEAQTFIDKAAKEDREAFEEYLLDLFYEEAEEAAQEYLFTDYVEGYGPNKYKVKVEEEDEEEIANLTEAITTKQEIDGIVVDINDYDLDLRNDKITAYMNMWVSDDQEVWLRFVYNDVLENAEFEWEADGQPTYVPYGEQSVLLDDGKGDVESVDIGELEPDEEVYETLDETVLSKDDVLNILKIDEEQLTKLEKAARKIASKYLKPIIEEHIKDDSDFWPDKDDYDPRDDYDPFN